MRTFPSWSARPSARPPCTGTAWPAAKPWTRPETSSTSPSPAGTPPRHRGSPGRGAGKAADHRSFRWDPAHAPRPARETVAAGGQLLRVARMDRVRVEAEIDEFDLSRVRLSSPVKVHAEGMAGSWRGHVEEVPANVVGRKLKPQDPARPSDTRILLVKVALDEPTPLKLGQRVELELEP